MKFKLVEEFFDESILTEDDESSLREFVCDLLNKYCNYYPDSKEFIIHHKNGNHNQNNVENIILLPTYQLRKNWNTSIHNYYKYNKFNKFNLNDTKYRNTLLLTNGIDVWKSINKGDIVDVSGNSLRGKL